MVSVEILLISLNFMFIALLLEKYLPLRIIRNLFCPMIMEGKELTITIYNLEKFYLILSLAIRAV